jgi:hypothetical protein
MATAAKSKRKKSPWWPLSWIAVRLIAAIVVCMGIVMAVILS